MPIKITVALIGLLAIGAGAPLLAAQANPAEAPSMSDPTVNQVFEAARTGHVDQARQMMDQVLANHPHSARAHYVAAQLDADMKNFGEARDQLKTAEEIDPGLSFANAQAVAALRKQIGLAGAEAGPVRGSAPGPGLVARSPGRSFPWPLLWIVGGIVLLAWLLMRRRQVVAPAYTPYPGTMPNAAAGPAPMVPPGGFPSVVGGGSGIVGGLASGLAVGAGVAAGEELVRHAFESNHGAGSVMPEAVAGSEAPPPPNADMGGTDFGIRDEGGWDDGGGASSSDDGGDWT
ncbi:MAG TPA: tetratricopeptide repeat protein [Steroidobacteraceae bacterium]|nr:tetratricopeptide repeat protein [Steroidobacteraceae bacterium]